MSRNLSRELAAEQTATADRVSREIESAELVERLAFDNLVDCLQQTRELRALEARLVAELERRDGEGDQ